MNPNLQYCNHISIQEGNLKPPLPFVNLVFVFEKKSNQFDRPLFDTKLHDDFIVCEENYLLQ